MTPAWAACTAHGTACSCAPVARPVADRSQDDLTRTCDVDLVVHAVGTEGLEPSLEAF